MTISGGIWPFREWVVNAYNRNLSFKDFTIRQLAGDLLDEPTQEDRIATGFLKSNASTHEGGVIREEYRIKYLKDRTETFAQVWLGLTAECASCHDHKYDPISMADYYSLSAFFAGIDEPVMNGDNSLGGRKNPIIRFDHLALDPKQLEIFLKDRPGPEASIARPIIMASTLLEAKSVPGTISMWVSPQLKDGELLSQIDAKGAGWRLFLKDRVVNLEWMEGKGQAVSTVATKTPLPEGQVNHIAVGFPPAPADAAVQLYFKWQSRASYS